MVEHYSCIQRLEAAIVMIRMSPGTSVEQQGYSVDFDFLVEKDCCG